MKLMCMGHRKDEEVLQSLLAQRPNCIGPAANQIKRADSGLDLICVSLYFWLNIRKERKKLSSLYP